MKKKILALFIVIIGLMFVVTGCGEKSNLDGLTVNEISTKLFEGMDNDIPKLVTLDITEENMSYYIGVESLDIKEAVVSEPMMGSIAFSVAVIRVNDGVDIEKAKSDIKNSVDPVKWICVEADEVEVTNRDNVILLVMTSSISHPGISSKIINNFKNM